eukprot:5432497-Pyramimonas_sp.AAC.1
MEDERGGKGERSNVVNPAASPGSEKLKEGAISHQRAPRNLILGKSDAFLKRAAWDAIDFESLTGPPRNA